MIKLGLSVFTFYFILHISALSGFINAEQILWSVPLRNANFVKLSPDKNQIALCSFEGNLSNISIYNNRESKIIFDTIFNKKLLNWVYSSNSDTLFLVFTEKGGFFVKRLIMSKRLVVDSLTFNGTKNFIISPALNLCATIDSMYRFQIYNFRSGEQLANFEDNEFWATNLAFSCDEREIYIVQENFLRCFSLDSLKFKENRAYLDEQHKFQIFGTFDNMRIVVYSEYGLTKIFDRSNLILLKELNTAPQSRPFFSHNYQYLYTVHIGYVIRYNLESLLPFDTLEIQQSRHSSFVMPVASYDFFENDDDLNFLECGNSSAISLWSFNNRSIEKIITLPNLNGFDKINISSKYITLHYNSNNLYFLCVDIENANYLKHLKKNDPRIIYVPSDNSYFEASKTIKLYDLSTDQLKYEFENPFENIPYNIGFSPNKNYFYIEFISHTGNSLLSIYDCILGEIAIDSLYAFNYSWSNESNQLIYWDSSNSEILWKMDLENGFNKIKTILKPIQLKYSIDDKYIFSELNYLDSIFYLFSDYLNLSDSIALSNKYYNAHLTKNNDYLIIGTSLKQIQIWYLPEKRLAATIEKASLYTVNIEGTRLLANTGNGYLTCFDISGVITSAPAERQNPERDNLLVYPNPANGKITIAGISGITQIGIYNSAGIKLLSFVASAEESIEADISSLPSGVYYCVANTGEKVTAAKFSIVR